MTARAVVIGASMAGLLAARVLRDTHDEVVVLDRDELPDEARHRRGVPQGRHLHVLLARGLAVLEDLFPGLTGELTGRGAQIADQQETFRFVHDGHRLAAGTAGFPALGASRPLVEDAVRRRLVALPGVEIRRGHAVAPVAERRRVTGIRISDGESDDVLAADLVVDASGRSSRSPVWLAELGFPVPEAERVTVDLCYSSRHYRREPRHFDGGDGVIVTVAPPDLPRGGGALPQEGDRWIVTLFGMLGVEPPLDHEGFVAYADTLAVPDLAELLRDAEPLDDAVRTRFPASVRRRYEHVTDAPEGWLVVGDAICSVNPAYGQGMTVAAAQAGVLRECLRGGRSGLAQRFYRGAARVVDTPWSMVTGGDLRFAAVDGPRPLPVRLGNRYLARVSAAAAADPVVARAFLRVTNLLDRPERLLAPDVSLRVLRAALGVAAR